jgi:PAS domain S-box-containing protein
MRADEKRSSSAASAGPGRVLGPPGVAAGEIVETIIETCDDAILVCDREGRTTTWSANAERLFGCPASHTLGQPLPLLFANHVRGDVAAMVYGAMSGDRIVHFESEVLRTDGMPVPVSMSASPLPGPDGATAGLVVVVRDVTEQRLAQATLAEVEVRQREGESLAHMGSWLWDLRSDVVQWTIEFHRIHGIDPLEFGGTLEAYLDVVHPDDRVRLREAMQASAASRRPLEEEYRLAPRPAAGYAGSVVVRAQPTVGSAGDVIGLRGIGQRVTRDRRDA